MNRFIMMLSMTSRGMRFRYHECLGMLQTSVMLTGRWDLRL